MLMKEEAMAGVGRSAKKEITMPNVTVGVFVKYVTVC
jgi:hypothetical protein